MVSLPTARSNDARVSRKYHDADDDAQWLGPGECLHPGAPCSAVLVVSMRKCVCVRACVCVC